MVAQRACAGPGAGGSLGQLRPPGRGVDLEGPKEFCTLKEATPTKSDCNPNANFSVGGKGPSLERTLLTSGVVPSNAIILDGFLILGLAHQTTKTPVTLEIHRVTQAWTSSATWNTYDGSHAWMKAGGDYAEGGDTAIEEDVGGESGGKERLGPYSFNVTELLQEWANVAVQTEAKTKGTSPSHYLYKLDGVGNRTSQQVSTTAETGGSTTYYVLNAGNELECRQTVTGSCSKNSSTELSAYTYDGAAEETAITPEADTSGTTFAYNAASELSSLTPSGSAALALSYGGTGQDDLTALGSTTTQQNSQLGLTREVSSAGTSYYARTPTGLLIDQRTPSGHYNPLYDAQGDIIALVNSSGKVERTFRYGPYGENTKSEGAQSIPYPFGYKSGYRMPGGNKGEGNVANGLYHFGERYYDPTTGRWTQPDPGSDTADYVFTGDDPINDGDPSGRGVECAIELDCEVLHKVVAFVEHTGLYHAIDEETVSWGEFVHRLQTAFHVGKEVFGYAHCAYELAEASGPCKNP
jgi:RHS repeat-associated protein